MPLMLPFRLLWLSLLVAFPAFSSAHSKYVARLPNGANVPDSNAVGHVDVDGSGALNAFGRHFISSARTWSMELCRQDSDGDGQTNGQELGDPCCEWVLGDTPRFTTGISHPGNESDMADTSRWKNITCFNETKLSLWERSAAWRWRANPFLMLAVSLGVTVFIAM